MDKKGLATKKKTPFFEALKKILEKKLWLLSSRKEGVRPYLVAGPLKKTVIFCGFPKYVYCILYVPELWIRVKITRIRPTRKPNPDPTLQ